MISPVAPRLLGGRSRITLLGPAFASVLTLATAFSSASAAAPAITFQPTPQATILAGKAIFTVIATGEAPLSYRWRKDGVDLSDGGGTSGAGSDALTLSGVEADDAGAYSVVVTNGSGQATSVDAPLAVGVPRGGDVDFSFERASSINDAVQALAVQPNGKLLVVGSFNTTHGAVRRGIGRLNADGTTDHSFLNGRTGAGLNESVRVAAVQPDGKVLVGGDFTEIDGVARGNVARLLPDGGVDASFLNASSGVDGSGLFSIAVQPDGKVLVGGFFTTVNGVGRGNLARLNGDGSLDTTFMNGMAGTENTVHSFALQPDGKVLVGGYFSRINGVIRGGIARLNANGSVDATFQNGMSGADGPVYSVVLQPDGKVLIGGGFGSVNGVARGRVARLNGDGSLDATFMNGMAGVDGTVQSMALEPGGKVVVGGQFSQVHGTSRGQIARLNADGSLDAGFLNGMSGVDQSGVLSVALQPNGKLLIGGRFTTANGVGVNRIARLNGDGSVDASFGTGAPGPGPFGAAVQAVAPQDDGKAVLGGIFDSEGSPFNIVRVNEDGSLDTGFLDGMAGISGGFGGVHAFAQAPGGKILVGGDFRYVNGTSRGHLVRLNPDGSIDPTFGNVVLGIGAASYAVYSIVLQPDGKVIVGGRFSWINSAFRSGFARLNADGTLDTSFGSGGGGMGYFYSMALQPDGKILVGGLGFAGRRNADGSPDATFQATIGGGGAIVYSVVLQPDGKVLIGGTFTQVNGTSRNGIARLHPDGSVDTSFQDGMSGAGSVYSVALRPDGKVLIGGAFDTVNGVSRKRIARLHPDGSLDTTFEDGMGGADDSIRALALLPDGRVLVGGAFVGVNGVVSPLAARLYGDAPVSPEISAQPSSQISYDGCCAIFRVTASGTPRDYRWRKDGVDLADGGSVTGASSSTLTLTGVSAADEGAYSVVVSNVLGAETSDDATLTVAEVPECFVATCDASLGCALSPGPDSDGDAVANSCDNCPLEFNASQSDLDQDATGDVCDLDDGEIWEWRASKSSIDWQAEQGPTSWNVYVGDLDVLKGTGAYTQVPGSNPLAARHCGQTATSVAESTIPALGKVSFSLVTGVTGGTERSLGASSSGARPNASPCP